MIYELVVRNSKRTPVPHWPKVPFLQHDTIHFAPGLNIIFGPNGSGKSTLLTGLAILLHCKDENWPRVSKKSLMHFNRPMGLVDGLMIEHDGSPARYLGIDQELDIPPEKAIEMKSIALSSKTSDKALHQQSAGQATVTKLVRFLRADAKKVRYAIKTRSLPPKWGPIFRVGTEAIKNVSTRQGMPKQSILLLDEIDRSLDFAKQAQVWSQLRQLAAMGTYQLIVASHSPFAVNVPNAHYIETVTGYLDASRKALSLLLKDAA